jgi:hypothetical protein
MPVYWEPWIEKGLTDMAIEKNRHVSWLVNYLIATKMNELEEEEKAKKEKEQASSETEAKTG